MRLLSWLIGLPIAVVAVSFAVSNKAATTFALWPLPVTLEAPLYLATLIALLTGFVAGGIIAWFGQGRHRSRARRLADKVYLLEREMSALQHRATAAEKQLAEARVPVSGEPPKTASSSALPAPRLPATA